MYIHAGFNFAMDYLGDEMAVSDVEGNVAF